MDEHDRLSEEPSILNESIIQEKSKEEKQMLLKDQKIKRRVKAEQERLQKEADEKKRQDGLNALNMRLKASKITFKK